jgi:DNA-binding HxlR family transcriptional regulator
MLPQHRNGRHDDNDADEVKCPIRQILGRVGGRWTLDLIMLLGKGPHHFADLDRCIPKISRRMLTLTLRGLERDGLVARYPSGTAGSIVTYEITDLGRELDAHLHALTEWSRDRRDAIYSARDRYDAALA